MMWRHIICPLLRYASCLADIYDEMNEMSLVYAGTLSLDYLLINSLHL